MLSILVTILASLFKKKLRMLKSKAKKSYTTAAQRSETMNKKTILDKAERLMQMHKSGLFGGEVMPEDANPHLEKGSQQNNLYFTLPMALNYQRNSYSL